MLGLTAFGTRPLLVVVPSWVVVAARGGGRTALATFGMPVKCKFQDDVHKKIMNTLSIAFFGDLAFLPLSVYVWYILYDLNIFTDVYVHRDKDINLRGPPFLLRQSWTHGGATLLTSEQFDRSAGNQ